MHPFRESSLAKIDELRASLSAEGYVFIKSLLPPESVRDVRRTVVRILNDAGWILPGGHGDAVANSAIACRMPDPEFARVYWQVFSEECVHALAHSPAILGLMEQIVQERVLVHPKKQARIVLPRSNYSGDYSTRTHQDFVTTQGTPDTFTAWIPLGDCPMTMGALAVARASHTSGVLDFQPNDTLHGFEVRDPLEGTWTAGDFECGDVLIFHGLTAHKALSNSSNCVRVSIDARYQPASHPIAEGQLQLNEAGLSWPILYSRWSEQLRYYWRTLSPQTVAHDASFARQRDEAAIELGKSGDPRALPSLRFIAARASDPVRRQLAAALVQQIAKGASAKPL